MLKQMLILWSLLPVLMTMKVSGQSEPVGMNVEGNPEKVALVKAGKLKEARADWWGFDSNDATKCLQTAIDSGVAKLVIPNMGKPWIVHPIALAGDQEITLEPGTVVEAIRGGFKGRNDALFAARGRKNIVIRGYEAALRMHKPDYQDTNRYEKAEWRHTLTLLSCENVKILGLLLQSSGGDGIYAGNCREPLNYCKDIVIKDCVIDDHHRQGISVISVVNLLVENCVIKNTKGTPPGAGIDFEPNAAYERLFNITVRNCVFENNVLGVIIQANVDENSGPISFIFDNCRAVSNSSSGFSARFGGYEMPPRSKIDCAMTNCVEISKGKTKVFNDFWKDLMNSQTLDKQQADLVDRIKKMDVTKLKLKPVEKPAQQTSKASEPLSKQIPRPFLRGESHFILYAKEGEDVVFKASYREIVRPKRNAMSVRILSPSGGEVPIESTLVAKTEEFSFSAKETGAYIIACDPAGFLARVESAAPPITALAEKKPVAMLALKDPFHFFGQEGLFYFYVPAGIADFYIQAAGSGGERVKVGLYDADGKLVEEQDNICLIHRFVVSRKDASKGDIWMLKTGKASDYDLEDYFIDLFGVPPVLSTERGDLLMPEPL